MDVALVLHANIFFKRTLLSITSFTPTTALIVAVVTGSVAFLLPKVYNYMYVQGVQLNLTFGDQICLYSYEMLLT